MDAKNVHSNWTKEEASEGWGWEKSGGKKERRRRGGRRRKVRKNTNNNQQGRLTKRTEKKTRVEGDVVTSNSECPMRIESSRVIRVNPKAFAGTVARDEFFRVMLDTKR